jgi:hypothetical protein
MKITINKEPCTYIVIEDWLPIDINKTIYKEILRVMPYMKPSITYAHDSNSQVQNKTFKSSQNLWMYQFYQAMPNEINIGKIFEEQLWSPEVKQALIDTGDSLFRQMLYTDHSQLLLSKYEQNDHYHWHRDYNDTITINYLIGREPRTWSGGDFEFGTWDSMETASSVPFKNNTLIIFPSRILHRVTPVENFFSPSYGARFTLQYWGKLKHVVEQ